MSQGGPVNQNVSSALWQKPKQWEAVERFTNMMFCCLFLLLQGHHKDKNNPPWQICFQKVSLSFSIISEKYCLIVLTPIECFDRGLMYYPVFPVFQKLPPLVLGKNVSGKLSFGNLTKVLLYSQTHVDVCQISNLVKTYVQTHANER